LVAISEYLGYIRNIEVFVVGLVLVGNVPNYVIGFHNVLLSSFAEWLGCSAPLAPLAVDTVSSDVFSSLSSPLISAEPFTVSVLQPFGYICIIARLAQDVNMAN
jgi:hypothetical protein